MGTSKRGPKLFSQVVQAVTDLRDSNGSSTRRILDQVRLYLNDIQTIPKPRNVVMHVRRALRHGVESGRLVHRAGRYRLANKREPVGARVHRRRGGRHRRRSRSRKRRRRRGRHHSSGESEDDERNCNHKRCTCKRATRQRGRGRPRGSTRKPRVEKPKPSQEKIQPEAVQQQGTEQNKGINEEMDTMRPGGNTKNLKRAENTKPAPPFARQGTPHPKGPNERTVSDAPGPATTRARTKRPRQTRRKNPKEKPHPAKETSNEEPDEDFIGVVPNPRAPARPERSPLRDLRDDEEGPMHSDEWPTNLRQSPEKHDDRPYLN